MPISLRTILETGLGGGGTTVNTQQRTTNATHFLAFVDSNNATATAESVYTTSSFVINPSTGNVGVGGISPIVKLDVNGSIRMVPDTSSILYIGRYSVGYAGAAVSFTSDSGNPTFASFQFNGTEKMRLTFDSQLGIGTIAPTSNLDVAGTAKITGITTVTNTTNATSTITGALQVAGGVGIGRDVWIGGTANATIFNSLSDRTLKKDIVEIENAVNIINQLRGVQFAWQDSNLISYGFIAQDIEQVLPEVVNTNDNGIKSLNYDAVIPFLVEAIKNLSARVSKLEGE